MSEAEQGRTSGRATWWKHELKRRLVLFLYLWTLLALFVLNEDVANRQAGHPFMFQGFVLVNALILTKVMLVSEQLDLSRRLSTWPRIWVILCGSLFCTVLFLFVLTLERIVIGLIHGQSPSASMPSFGGAARPAR